MEKTIEVGADWQKINECRQHLVMVWHELTSERQYTSPQEALIAGQVAEAFKNAEEALFETVNLAQSQGDPNAQEAVRSLGPGLIATTIAPQESRQETTP